MLNPFESIAPIKTLDVALLAKELDWATSEWRKQMSTGESEWVQYSWFCGTASCVAGKIALDAGWTPQLEDGDGSVYKDDVGSSSASTVANVELGLTDVQHNLFDGDNKIWDLWRVAEWLTHGELRAPLEVDEAAFNEMRSKIDSSNRVRTCYCGCGMFISDNENHPTFSPF